MASRRKAKPDPVITAGSVSDPPDLDGLDQLLGYHLRRAQVAAHRDFIAAMGDLVLTQKQTGVMWLVQSNPGAAQGAIGAELGMDRATMKELVDRLEARGLLQRRRSGVDARRRDLHATPAGKRLMERARVRIARHEARMKRLFSEDELFLLERLLQRLQALDVATG